jgi:hypothetical protein
MTQQYKPAPKGWRWVFCAKFWHARAKRYLYARDYGRECWAFLVRA